MKRYLIASFLAFSLATATPTALAASSGSTDSRYFVQTTKSFWRNAFGARHVFPDGFTADLSGLQLQLVRFAGLKAIPVKKFNILVDAAVAPALTTTPIPKPDPSPIPTPTPQNIPATPVGWGVRAVLGNDTLTATVGGKGIAVAILDTGIDRDHPDLNGRVKGCTDLTDPANGEVADSCDDLNGHGTHMAGIIAADGGPDGVGMYGVAPEADLLVYRVCNRTGLCLSDDIAVAMRDAVNQGAQIIVLGLGGEAQSSFIADAIAYATQHEVLVVAAAGNDGPYDDSLDWPARDVSVISVGALGSDGEVAQFSSRGANDTTKPYRADQNDLELVAPGVNIESTFKDQGYAILSGTSMAAPHVAGLAALVWQKSAAHPANATRLILHEMSKDIAPVGDDNASGWGMPIISK